MPRCAKVRYCTRTCSTHFGNTTGLPVPILNPNHHPSIGEKFYWKSSAKWQPAEANGDVIGGNLSCPKVDCHCDQVENRVSKDLKYALTTHFVSTALLIA